jgi:hypothetical protein
MSIFRNTFNKTIQGQLNRRQLALQDRKPQSILQLNSRNSWVRMTSGVNVKGSSALAENYVMLGGVLLNKKSRFGVGDASKAYSTGAPSLNPYNTDATAGTAGIKPMPGITSMDVKSKSAYGSLREVTVNFVCNNIQQLEDLELLYMRPGYTVLIEWGWTPFLDNSGALQNNIKFYDGVLKGGIEREQIFKDLFDKSKEHFGNYDALYGYVKNYNWTARMDGGYDCTTTVISIGEILESLKVGWISSNVNNIVSNGGLLGTTFATPSDSSPISQYIAAPKVDFNNFSNALKKGQSINNITQAYSKNILAGICYELYNFCISKYPEEKFPRLPFNTVVAAPLTLPYYDYDFFVMPYKNNTTPSNTLVKGSLQAYVTLRSFIDILNKYILLYAGTSEATSKPFITLSVQANEYEGNAIEDPKDNPKNLLLCLAHPLQVSVDPTVCLITNNIWAKGIDTSGLDEGSGNDSFGDYDSQALEIYNQLENTGSGNNAIGTQLLKYIGYSSSGTPANNIKEFLRSFAKAIRKKKPNTTAGGVRQFLFKLSDNLVPSGEFSPLGADNATFNSLFDVSIVETNDKEDKAKAEALTKLAKGESPFGVQYLTDLQSKGKPTFEYKNELGKIGNIYLNLDRLYQLAIDPSLQDQNQELNVFSYLKQILKEVQGSIGGVNSFEIHVDPIDNIARIIDLNYIDYTSRTTAYNDAFQIEMQNTLSTVRSYNLQSQIFPEQASMIAIGAQVGGGGVQATQNNTLLDFNNNLTDRIITKKLPPITQTPPSGSQLSSLIDSFVNIKAFFFPSQEEQINIIDPTKDIDQNDISQYKTSLKDIITYFQGISNSNTKNRAIIPIKISLTMDGIGGLVIGHLFKIPPDLLPRGYKSDALGGKLLQAVTGISHKVEGGDWTTTIDAYNIVTNEPSGNQINFKDYTTINPETGQVVITATPNSTKPYDNVSAAVKFFTNKGYKDYQVAAIVGALITESNLLPTATLTDNTGSTLGIAQWRGPRQTALRQKTGFDTLNVQLNFIVEEFTGSESSAGRALSNASTFAQAVVAMAKYERFYPKDYIVTFENLSRDYSRRVNLSQDVLTRIKAKEFTQTNHLLQLI